MLNNTFDVVDTKIIDYFNTYTESPEEGEFFLHEERDMKCFYLILLDFPFIYCDNDYYRSKLSMPHFMMINSGYNII